MRRQKGISPRVMVHTGLELETARNASELGAVPFAHANLGESLDIRWYRHKLKEKKCNRFVIADPNTLGARNPCCACGYRESDHTERALKNAEDDGARAWESKEDTYLRATTAFGELEFVGYGQKISKFAKVANDTKMDVLLELLMKQWNLEKPNLVISVTGGAKNFTMKPRLKQVFNQGLMKAAKSTSAWIITGGMHAGVMKHVGEAVRTSELSAGSKNKATVIGIAPWGCVANRQVLVGEEGKWPAQYILDTNAAQNESPLDMNHSHFILVDNGTQGRFATEIQLRAELEAAVGELKSGFDVVSVPRVCVLLEGGPGSLETVKSAIENDTPAVVVDGSGRSADVIAYAFHNAREIEEEHEENGVTNRRCKLVLSGEVRERVRLMLTNIFGDSPRMDQWLSWVDKCIENKDMLTIFSLDANRGANSDIDMSLLTALLKAKKNRIQDQLKLALAWNRIDIAKNQIFSKDRQWKQSELTELMMAALKLGRVDFIQLFLENGINMKQFMTVKRLMELYNSIPKNSALNNLLHKIERDRNTPFELRDVGNLIKELMGNFYQPLYMKGKYRKLSTSGKPGDGSLDLGYINEAYDREWEEKDAEFTEPSRELFIWAVLMNMRSMATLLWIDAKDPMAGALTACKLLKGLAYRTHDTDQKKNFEESAEEFQSLATEVLNECYVADVDQAEHLLIREQPNFGNATCLQLAVQANSEDFVAHPCVQMLLNRIWKGKISPENGTWRFLLCIMCPILIFALLYYREDEVLNIKKRDHTGRNRAAKITRQDTSVGAQDLPEHKKNESEHRVKTRNTNSGQTLDFYDLGRPLTFIERLKYFYTAPIVVFTFNCISYLTFLALFSYSLLVEYSKDGIGNVETILVIWVLTLICEEIRQLQSESSNPLTALRIYLSYPLNCVDICTLFLFFLALIMRFFPQTFEAPRYILCLCLALFYMRLLHIFSVFKQLGPMLIMIKRMLIDLTWFLLIIAVFMVAYGVVRHAILYPNSPFSGLLIYSVLRSSYWQMQGEIEMFLGETEDGACGLVNGTLSGCTAAQLIVPPLMALYIIFTNILMFNLLIAMFSYTFNAIQENNERVWSFQRYSLIQEYYERPPIPPPFIIFFHVWLLARWLMSFCCVKFNEPWKGDCRITFRRPEEKIREKQLVLWENMNADEYARKRDLIDLETSEYKIQETRLKTELLHTKFDAFQEQLQQSGLMFPPELQKQQSTDASNRELELKVQSLEDKLDQTNEALDWIKDHLRRQRSPSRRRSKRPSQAELPDTEVRSRSIGPEAVSRWPDLYDVTEDTVEFPVVPLARVSESET